MSEALRQQYLKRMGFTPWVARRALPGAAPSPVSEEVEAGAPAPAPAAVSATPANNAAAAPSLSAHLASTVADKAEPPPEPAAKDAVPATPRQAEQPDIVASVSGAVDGEPVVFGLEVHRVGSTWLLAAQDDPYAPGLGRFEAPLMTNLLKAIGRADPTPRRFYCPLTETPMFKAEAIEALQGFVNGLVNQTNATHLLFLLPESLAEQLLAQPRYQVGEFCQCPTLVVSSLAEMLDAPAVHKRRTWHAIQPFLNIVA